MLTVAGKLGIKLDQRAVTVNAPTDGIWDIPAEDETNPTSADVVVGFIECRRDMGLLSAVFTAVFDDRRAWICFPKPGHRDSDVDRDWLFRELYRYNAGPVNSISVDENWAAVLLRAGLYSDADITELLAWPDKSVEHQS